MPEQEPQKLFCKMLQLNYFCILIPDLQVLATYPRPGTRWHWPDIPAARFSCVIKTPVRVQATNGLVCSSIRKKTPFTNLLSVSNYHQCSIKFFSSSQCQGHLEFTFRESCRTTCVHDDSEISFDWLCRRLVDWKSDKITLTALFTSVMGSHNNQLIPPKTGDRFVWNHRRTWARTFSFQKSFLSKKTRTILWLSPKLHHLRVRLNVDALGKFSDIWFLEALHVNQMCDGRQFGHDILREQWKVLSCQTDHVHFLTRKTLQWKWIICNDHTVSAGILHQTHKCHWHWPQIRLRLWLDFCSRQRTVRIVVTWEIQTLNLGRRSALVMTKFTSDSLMPWTIASSPRVAYKVTT